MYATDRFKTSNLNKISGHEENTEDKTMHLFVFLYLSIAELTKREMGTC